MPRHRAEAVKNGARQLADVQAGGAAAAGVHAYAAVNGGNGSGGSGSGGGGESPRSNSSRLSFEVEDAAARASPAPNPTVNPILSTSLPAVLLLRESLGAGAAGPGNAVALRSPSTGNAGFAGGGLRASSSGGAVGAEVGPFGAGSVEEDAPGGTSRDRPPVGKGKRSGRAGAPGNVLRWHGQFAGGKEVRALC